MKIPQIEIRQQYARIEISTQPSRQEIRQKQADLEIKRSRGKLKMQHKDAKVEIDSYPSRYDLGYKNLRDFRKANIKLAEEAVMKRVAKYASQGDRMMKIEQKGNALQDVISEESTPAKKELGLKWLRGPEFNVIPAHLKINYAPGGVKINVKTNSPEFKFHRGKVDIRMAQYAEVEINWEGHYLNTMV